MNLSTSPGLSRFVSGGGGVDRASPEAHVEPDHPESWHSWVDPPPFPGSIVVGPLEVVTGPNTRSHLSPVIPEAPLPHIHPPSYSP